MYPMTDHLLKPADRAEVTVIVDNYIDIFVPPATPVDQRLPFNSCRTLFAEHGFSCLVRVFSGKKNIQFFSIPGFRGTVSSITPASSVSTCTRQKPWS